MKIYLLVGTYNDSNDEKLTFDAFKTRELAREELAQVVEELKAEYKDAITSNITEDTFYLYNESSFEFFDFEIRECELRGEVK